MSRSPTLLAHCDFLSFLDGFRVGSSKVKEKSLKNNVGENTRSLKCKYFFLKNTYRCKMR
jgi:hypothetical protein